MDFNLSENTIAVFSAVGTALIAFAYKFFRILKSDKNTDDILSSEKDFRISLREECKSLRESNALLTNEKIDLVSRLARAEAQVEYLKQKCDICGHKTGNENE